MRNPLEPVVLGPVLVGDRAVVLRPGRASDAAEWRRIRLRDEALIAPYWISWGPDWESEHSDAVWLRKLGDDRDQSRAGTAIHFVVEVDGRLAGQVDLTGLDTSRHDAEVGIWIDSTLAKHRLGALVGAMAVDYAFEVLGCQRVTAPIRVDNTPAQKAAGRWGMSHEARMASYLEVGGTRWDHDLWAILRDDHPTAAVSRVLGAADAVSTGVHVGITHLRGKQVVPDTAGAAVVLARQRLGRWRDRLTGARGTVTAPATPPAGPVIVIAHRDRHTAVVRVVRVGGGDGDGDGDNLVSAVTAAVGDALGPGGMQRVWATCHPGDDALARAFASAGMRREGTMRDHVDLDGRRGDHDLWAITEPRLPPGRPGVVAPAHAHGRSSDMP